MGIFGKLPTFSIFMVTGNCKNNISIATDIMFALIRGFVVVIVWLFFLKVGGWCITRDQIQVLTQVNSPIT